MTFKNFYFNQFRPTYLEGFVRSILEYDLIITKNCASICDKELAEIKLFDIDRIIKETDDTYSFSRAKKVRHFIRRIMKNAYANRLIDFDISAYEFRKLKRRPQKDVELFTPEQLNFLLGGDDDVSKMFRFAMLTGLRREELLALEWKNVDMTNRQIYICQTIVIFDNKSTLVEDTKSHKFRYVPLCETAYKLLITLDSSSSKFVFHGSKGDYISLRTYCTMYNKLFAERNREYRKRSNKSLPYLTAHKLRHSFASQLVNNGVDVKTASALLGHSTTDITQLYLHTSEQSKQQAVKQLDELAGGE